MMIDSQDLKEKILLIHDDLVNINDLELKEKKILQIRC